MYVYSKQKISTQDLFSNFDKYRSVYVHVDSEYKSMPIDWGLGYDALVTYSFLNIFSAGNEPIGGFVWSLFRDDY